MDAASAVDEPAAPPPGLRRAHTARLSLDGTGSPPFASARASGASGASGASAVAARKRASTMAVVAAEAAASASASASASAAHGISTSFAHHVDPSQTPAQTASGEVVETLYSHPAAKIISFTAGARNFVEIGSSAGRSRNSRRSISSTTEDDIEPGTLPWSSQFERTIAVSALSIYRAPGSVAFLSCGSALQPILPKSQCWCIDEESSKFILQIRRPQYWRIEIPVGDGGENDERARRFRDVLGLVLQFEKTPCPFKRAFTVELPARPSTPLKKRPWTPVRRAESDVSYTPSAPSGLTRSAPRQQQRRRSSSPVARRVSPSVSPPPPQFATPITPTQPMEFTRREWAAMLQDQHKAAEEFDEDGRRLVPALVAEHERIIMDLKASEIEVNKMGTPWRNNGSYVPSSADRQGGRSRDRALSLASDGSVLKQSAWSGADRKWSEVLDSDLSTNDSSSPFNSIRSWLSPGRTLPPSSPPSSAGSLAAFPTGPDGAPAALASLFEDAKMITDSTGAVAASSEGQQDQLQQQQEQQQEPQKEPQQEQQQEQQQDQKQQQKPQQKQKQQKQPQPPRIRHRATTSSISVSTLSALPPAVSILTPARHLRSFNSSGRATTRLEAMRRIPGSIVDRVIEILLRPPSYLITLMLRVATRILSGEWRGSAVGTTDSGESIPVQWDYTDVEDPLGFTSEMRRRRAVNYLSVHSEADVEELTDTENNHRRNGNGERSLSSTPKGSSRARSATGKSTSVDDETLSDVGEDRLVWTRRWAVD